MGARRVLRRRRDRSRGSAALLVLLGIVLALVAAFLIWTAVEKAAFERRVERIRRAGDPVYPADLARPPVPDEKNAAKLLEQAAVWLERRQEQEDNDEDMLWESESHREHWTRGDWDRVDAYLKSVAPYFRMLEQVPERPQWRLDLKWDDGVDMAIPALSWTSDAARYMVARVELDRGQWQRTERAARSAIFLLDFADRCRLPFVMGYLFKITTRDQAVQVLRVASAKPGFDAALSRSTAIRRLARVVMALLEYRQVHAEWPRDLAALGKMPLDPYSGAPFVYTRTEKGARIRAACPDKQGVGWTLEEWNLAWSFEE